MKHLTLLLFLLIAYTPLHANPCAPVDESWTAVKLLGATCSLYLGSVAYRINKDFQRRFARVGDIEAPRNYQQAKFQNSVIKVTQTTTTVITLFSFATATILAKSAIADVQRCIKNN